MNSKNKTSEDQGLSINSAEDWSLIRRNWGKNQVQRIQAHADRFFTSDDDFPVSRHILLSSIALFFVLFVLWANWATLDEVTRGDGKVIPSSEVQLIQHQEGGIIDQFLVKEGDEVQAGQILVRLRDVGASSDLASNKVRYLGLLATVTRLQAEAEGLDTVKFHPDVVKGVPQSVAEEVNAFNANKEQLQGQLNVLKQQLAQRTQELSELRTKEADIRAVINLSRQEKAVIEPLVEKGSAPKLELIQLERAIKERMTELNGVRKAKPRAQSAIEEAEARINEMEKSFKAKAQTELSSTLTEMNAIKETLSALKDRKVRTEVVSLVNGIVKDIKNSTVGGVIKPGDDIMEIVPLDDQLVVEVNIRPSDIAFLHPKQKAVVKITAYDYSIYGGLEGELVDISADTIMNEKGEHFYRVRVRTYENSLKRRGEILPIIPGMVASVDILTGEKTVMEYLLKPFIKTLDNAMNER